jgi:acyl-homoserine lactone acylase PvdQ
MLLQFRLGGCPSRGGLQFLCLARFSQPQFCGTKPMFRQEERHIAGLNDSVEVIRDRWGVPHMYAKNADDLFFAQWYITAQDR